MKVLALIAATMAVAMGSAPASATTALVHITTDFSFVPQTVSVLPGGSVEWRNDSENTTHTVTDESCIPDLTGCRFDREVAPLATTTLTFDEPGPYPYRCRIHNFTGTVFVVDAGGELPDLVVTGLTVTATSATSPNVVRVTTRIRNAGQAPAAKSQILLEYEYHGSWITIARPLTNPVAAGTSQSIPTLWNVTGQIGDFAIRATADGFSQLAESDETNNAFSSTASILAPPGTPGIDLTNP